ncbi:hypothetical protein, partial [Pandoraea sp.]|uniref:hypothetical protein n=1 Tax=Pandoraea sp. TaxID=1883445 RepID=UPI0035B1857B
TTHGVTPWRLRAVLMKIRTSIKTGNPASWQGLTVRSSLNFYNLTQCPGSVDHYTMPSLPLSYQTSCYLAGHQPSLARASPSPPFELMPFRGETSGKKWGTRHDFRCEEVSF